ncbi:dicarboxylate/amino acid:cation symporter [Trinickia caryophylli]|uniref:Aerobic C4-dicarboxylate transport protein n=2 Tax=Trinickia caryophylli TaxID=28094 RepID=A0A1X7GK08_TRICW|nr:dicarboxylate/amino acid:cation symporter [Trinickia caryophylli]PMS09134.1 dicarboxylate/amino acid:cation symporter [Trinickia caryophylli]TRX14974.1 dicarboxylate/amino acid:cation symporter [Trinickia caryophylli]WQE14830.1 dicarboxylate/amino acid:cation symporter [Trinickia caryophylli]SMF70876.1 aerobic C4-dicarboxylate transport protein [Trinickia caryophylli]GLU35034.1 C4-dicarboxylate transport protein [Trinickia caryophylli]
MNEAAVMMSTPRGGRKPFYRTLYFHVLVAIVLGVILGHFAPSLAVKMKPLGDAFIKLIKMVIGPIIFCTVVTGIAGMGDMKKVGRVGGKALLYFEVVSTFSLVVGLVAGHLFRPGAGFNLNPAAIDTKALAGYTTAAQHQNTVDFLLHIVPDTFASAFSTGNVLQILLISVLFGAALAALGERGKALAGIIDQFAHTCFGIVHIIMKVAAIGAFGSIAFTIGTYGIGAVLPLLKLIGSFYLTLVVFVFLVLGAISRALGFSIVRFMSYIREEILIVLGTSSSEAALPQMLEKLERLGCSKSVVGLVIPAGYSFNLDGTNIYLTMAVLFIAQAFNVELSLTQQLTLVGVAMLTSKGASGVAGAAFVMLTSTLLVFPLIPVSGMVLILGIHRFMGTGLAIVNTIGNGVATLAISAWERELDRAKLNAAMSRRRSG